MTIGNESGDRFPFIIESEQQYLEFIVGLFSNVPINSLYESQEIAANMVVVSDILNRSKYLKLPLTNSGVLDYEKVDSVLRSHISRLTSIRAIGLLEDIMTQSGSCIKINEYNNIQDRLHSGIIYEASQSIDPSILVTTKIKTLDRTPRQIADDRVAQKLTHLDSITPIAGRLVESMHIKGSAEAIVDTMKVLTRNANAEKGDMRRIAKACHWAGLLDIDLKDHSGTDGAAVGYCVTLAGAAIVRLTKEVFAKLVGEALRS